LQLLKIVFEKQKVYLYPVHPSSILAEDLDFVCDKVLWQDLVIASPPKAGVAISKL